MPQLWKAAHARGFPLDNRPQVKPLPCSSIADGSLIIDPFAKVYKCWELVGLIEHAVGTVNPDGSLIKTAVYNDVLERNPVTIEPCREHAYLPSCGCGCVCKAQGQSGTYHAPGCGTEKFLLVDKVRAYLERLDGAEGSTISINNLELELIEGRQRPKMSHCYVLV